ncbi:hypothetical protein [Pseudomonas petrae]|uniref:hypothetical protein n=1 Tax=Pseudomonas petrae TaxID=2912190 RepID=UPI001F1A3D8C|nr:hypothetical protein [Pseudomonas petrae]MCF7536175.1 hypothetical protein [Pseudomonas petrae]
MKSIVVNCIFALVAAAMPALVMAALTASWPVGLIVYVCCVGFFLDLGRPKAERGEKWQ